MIFPYSENEADHGVQQESDVTVFQRWVQQGEGPCPTPDSPPQQLIAGEGSSEETTTDLCYYHSFLFSSGIFI